MFLSGDSQYLPRGESSWCIPEYLEELRTSEPDLLAELVQLFVQDTTSGLVLLQQQILQLETGAVGRTLHGLKGSCRQIGGLQMGDILEEMEGSVERIGFDGASTFMCRLEAAFEALRDGIQKKVGAPTERDCYET